jgi:hypothetical protein
MEGAVDAGVEVVSTMQDGLITSIEVQTCVSARNSLKVAPTAALSFFKTRIGDGKPITYKMVDGIPVRFTATFSDLLFELLQRNPGLSKEKFEDLARKANFRRVTIREFLDQYIVAGKIKYENRKLSVKDTSKQSTTAPETKPFDQLFETDGAKQ